MADHDLLGLREFTASDSSILTVNASRIYQPQRKIRRRIAMIKIWFSLIKPSIIFGNLITAAGGFFLASHGHLDPLTCFAMLIGIALVMASGCVFNNYIDQDIDALMERTKNRALVQGQISSHAALSYAFILGSLGFTILLLHTNIWTTGIAAFAFCMYVIAYSLWFKRHSVWGTLIGGFSGAAPPLIGYSAARHHIDLGAMILFIMLLLWQMPHAYSLAIFRAKDYTKAAIPLLPLTQGIPVGKIHILIYIFGFICASSLLTLFGYTHYLYLISTLGMGAWWLIIAYSGFSITSHQQDALCAWGKKVFSFSIMTIIVLSLMMAIDFS